MKHDPIVKLTVKIVASFVRRNSVAIATLPEVIASVYDSLCRVRSAQPAVEPAPAVPIADSVQPDFLICLEDGHRLKVMRRYLRRRYQMTPAEYRKKWGLAPNYPMVAPNYSLDRARLAKQNQQVKERSEP